MSREKIATRVLRIVEQCKGVILKDRDLGQQEYDYLQKGPDRKTKLYGGQDSDYSDSPVVSNSPDPKVPHERKVSQPRNVKLGVSKRVLPGEKSGGSVRRNKVTKDAPASPKSCASGQSVKNNKVTGGSK
jgi:hypothetical protein